MSRPVSTTAGGSSKVPSSRSSRSPETRRNLPLREYSSAIRDGLGSVELVVIWISEAVEVEDPFVHLRSCLLEGAGARRGEEEAIGADGHPEGLSVPAIRQLRSLALRPRQRVSTEAPLLRRLGGSNGGLGGHANPSGPGGDMGGLAEQAAARVHVEEDDERRIGEG